MENWLNYILFWIWGPLLIVQIILVFFLGVYNKAGLDILVYAGWVVWLISITLGWLPIYVLKKEGGVQKGKSYVHTKKIVTTGIYSVMRHPQYTAGILFSLALILVAQDWLVLVLGLIMIPMLYFDIIIADKHELEKFGDEYKHYMERVPRTNFLLGIIRRIRE